MAQRLSRPGARTGAGAGAAVLAAGLVLGGCANHNAQVLVRQACGHVENSLALMRAGASPSATPVQAAGDRAAALQQLRDALPLAAQAAGQAAQWQALMTTLTESSRVPESDLVEALTQQCADSGTSPQPGGGSVPFSTAPSPGT